MLNRLLLLGEVVFLAAALPLAVIAALGYKDSPFGHVTVPLPFVIAGYLLADSGFLLFDEPPLLYYFFFAGIATVSAVYAAVSGVLILTGRKT